MAQMEDERAKVDVGASLTCGIESTKPQASAAIGVSDLSSPAVVYLFFFIFFLVGEAGRTERVRERE